MLRIFVASHEKAIDGAGKTACIVQYRVKDRTSLSLASRDTVTVRNPLHLFPTQRFLLDTALVQISELVWIIDNPTTDKEAISTHQANEQNSVSRKL